MKKQICILALTVFLRPCLAGAVDKNCAGHLLPAAEFAEVLRSFSDDSSLVHSDQSSEQIAAHVDLKIREWSARHSFSPINVLPIRFSDYGRAGVMYGVIFDYMALEGRAIVGYEESQLRNAPSGDSPGGTVLPHFFAGVVKRVAMTGRAPSASKSDLLKVTLELPNGQVRDLRLAVYRNQLFGAKLWILGTPQTAEERVRQFIENARLQDLPEHAFGSPSMPEDFTIALAAVQTMLSVPPTFSGTAVIKILLGRNVRGGPSYKYFGVARGKSRYNEKALQKFVGPLFAFAETVGIFGPDQSEKLLDATASDDKPFPEYLGFRRKTELSNWFLKFWSELSAVNSSVEDEPLEIIPPKPRDSASLRLTRAVAKPGTRVTVQSEIGLGSKSEGLAALHVMAWSPGGSAFDVPPGGVLEIVKGPRRVDNINLCRVRDPLTGREGELYWISLLASTKLTEPVGE